MLTISITVPKMCVGGDMTRPGEFYLDPLFNINPWSLPWWGQCHRFLGFRRQTTWWHYLDSWQCRQDNCSFSLYPTLYTGVRKNIFFKATLFLQMLWYFFFIFRWYSRKLNKIGIFSNSACCPVHFAPSVQIIHHRGFR